MMLVGCLGPKDLKDPPMVSGERTYMTQGCLGPQNDASDLRVQWSLGGGKFPQKSGPLQIYNPEN